MREPNLLSILRLGMLIGGSAMLGTDPVHGRILVRVTNLKIMNRLYSIKKIDAKSKNKNL